MPVTEKSVSFKILSDGGGNLLIDFGAAQIPQITTAINGKAIAKII